MTKRKGVLQKIALVSGMASFALALISGILLYLRLMSLGGNNPISASFMASTFFFICVGSVLTVIGRADIPNLKIDNSEGK
jgi:amino acid transporter